MIEKERFEVLLEEIKGGVKAVADGHGVIRNEMKRMEERLTEKISFVDGKVDFLAADVRALKQDVAEVKQDVAEVKKDVVEVKTDLAKVKEKVDKIDLTLEEHVRLPTHVSV